MKKIVSTPKKVERIVEVVTEEEHKMVDDGQDPRLEYLGKEVLVFGGIYIYTGRLTGVNGSSFELTSPSIVYETGSFDSKSWKDAQKLPTDKLLISTSFWESMCVVKR